ncbi:MAG: ABC transporter ATP-binding protein [Moraxellaceae bacterium]|nr:MAG: ABC transporter ATP-binding protein [Moraxellaceae bacterium]
MEPIIHIHNATKRYSKHTVFNRLNLAIGQGDCFALAGENGAGKSTLIKCILDFIELDQGAIKINGQANQIPLSRSNIAYLPERFNPPYYLTGKSFLNYIASLWQEEFDHKAITNTFEAIELDSEVLTRSVRTLSKGTIQKLGLAACFISHKSLLILDEPMSGLDPKARVLVKTLIASLKEQNRCVFFSSHLLADVDEVASRIAILHRGALVYDGSPQDCRARYQTKNLELAYICCIEANPPLTKTSPR